MTFPRRSSNFGYKVHNPSRAGRGRRGGRPTLLASLGRRYRGRLWRQRLDQLSWPRAVALKAARVAYLSVGGFVRDNCLFRASGLTYITVLSLVPLLAFAFSVAKGFGAYEALRTNAIEPWMDSVLPSTAGEGETTTRATIERMLELVDATDFNKLGIFGLAILLYTVFKLLGSVELAFNDIWGVRRARSVVRKLSDYVALVVITPILMTTGVGLFTLNQTGDDGATPLLFRAAPLFVILIGLGMIYMTLPNTRVRVASAFWGGLVGGSLTLMALYAHTHFQLGVANFDAIYAGFAAFPIFLVFIYFLWVTVLFGAEVAASHQGHGAFRRLMLGSVRSQAARERLALRMLTRLTLAFEAGDGQRTTAELGTELGAPESDIEELFEALADAGLVAPVQHGSEGGAWVLSASPAKTRLCDVLEALRNPESPEDEAEAQEFEVETLDEQKRMRSELDRSLEDLRRCAAESPANATLEELAERSGAARGRAESPIADGATG